MNHINIQPNSGFKGFFQAISAMAKQVWSGAWVVIVGVITAVYFTDPGIKYLTRDAWLTGHILLLELFQNKRERWITPFPIFEP
jgi:hypothetical protein